MSNSPDSEQTPRPEPSEMDSGEEKWIEDRRSPAKEGDPEMREKRRFEADRRKAMGEGHEPYRPGLSAEEKMNLIFEGKGEEPDVAKKETPFSAWRKSVHTGQESEEDS